MLGTSRLMPPACGGLWWCGCGRRGGRPSWWALPRSLLRRLPLALTAWWWTLWTPPVGSKWWRGCNCGWCLSWFAPSDLCLQTCAWRICRCGCLSNRHDHRCHRRAGLAKCLTAGRPPHLRPGQSPRGARGARQVRRLEGAVMRRHRRCRVQRIPPTSPCGSAWRSDRPRPHRSGITRWSLPLRQWWQPEAGGTCRCGGLMMALPST